MKLTLDLLPPSLNQYLRLHWAEKRKWRRDFAWALTAALIDAGHAPPPIPVVPLPPKMRVTVTIYRIRLYDHENLVGGMKPFWDAMRDINLIRNDSPRWLDPIVTQEHSRSPRVEVTIEVA